MGFRSRLLCGLTLLGALACGSESTSEREHSPPTETMREAPAPAPAPVPETEPAPEPPAEPCPHVVLDEDPPLRVRASASSSSEARGDLANGSLVEVVEIDGAWARIESPAGWVYRRNLYDTCASPPALPALPLGPRTYLVLDEWDETEDRSGEVLPGPPADEDSAALFVMTLRRRAEETLSTPVTVTLVTKTGSCVREATRRVVIAGHCPEWGSAAPALEVESCPELTRESDDRAYVTSPLMVGVVGRHEGARMQDWEHAEGEAPAAMLAAVRAKIRHPYEDDTPPIHTRFAGSRFSWVYHQEQHWLMLGDAVIDALDMTASEPMRVVREGQLLVAVGNQGHHGYGFYMFPRRPLPEQARDLWYPNFTCGAF